MNIIMIGYSIIVLGLLSARVWGKNDFVKSALMITIMGFLFYSLGLKGMTDWHMGEWNILAGERTSRTLQSGGLEESFLLTLGMVATIIFIFAAWYMSHDPFIKYFELTIATFAAAMMLFIVRSRSNYGSDLLGRYRYHIVFTYRVLCN